MFLCIVSFFFLGKHYYATEKTNGEGINRKAEGLETPYACSIGTRFVFVREGVYKLRSMEITVFPFELHIYPYHKMVYSCISVLFLRARVVSFLSECLWSILPPFLFSALFLLLTQPCVHLYIYGRVFVIVSYLI